MGGPGSGRFPADPEARVATLTEMQEKNLIDFRRYMEAEYPEDDQVPKRSRAHYFFDAAFQTALAMGRRIAGPSIKGFEVILPYLIGMPRQGITLEGNVRHEHFQGLNLSKLSDAELNQLETLLAMAAPAVCESCGSSCGGNCRKQLPGPVQ